MSTDFPLISGLASWGCLLPSFHF